MAPTDPPSEHPVGSDRWFRILAERNGDVFFAIRADPDFAVEYISETVNGWGGYRTEDYVANPQLLLTILDRQHASQMAQAMAAEPGRDIEFDFRWYHRDGRPVWSQNRARRRRREDGSVVLEGTAHDITELRLAQLQAQESEERLRLVLDNVGDAVLRFGADGTLLWASPSLNTILGWQPEEVVGTRFRMVADMDDEEVDRLVQDAVLEHRDLVRLRSRAKRVDGRIVWISNIVRILWDGDGEFEGVVCSLRDVTDQVNTERELATSREEFRLLAEQASDFTLRTDPSFTVEWVSPSVTRVLGWQTDEIVGKKGFEFLHPNDVTGTAESAAGMSAGESASGRIRLRTSDGGYRWMSQVATPVIDSGQLIARVSAFQDVDAQVRAEQALAGTERRFRMAMEFAPMGMAVLDLDRRFVEVNPALCRMTGRSQEWLLTHRVTDVLDADDHELDLSMRSHVRSGEADSASHDKRMVTADGNRIWVEHSVGLVRDDEGTPVSYVSQFLDVDEARKRQERLRFMAGHDALTSLPNRHQLMERVGQFLGRTPRTGTRLAILFIDLDRFKPINDTYGHAVGDFVLVEVARRIHSQVRKDDVVARLGGDEFIVALPAVHLVDDAQRMAAKIHAAFEQPLEIEGLSLTVTLSIGLTLAEPGEDSGEVLQRADEALYRAKGPAGTGPSTSRRPPTPEVPPPGHRGLRRCGGLRGRYD